METIKVIFPFSGRGKEGYLPERSKIIKIVRGKQTGENRIELEKDGYAVIAFKKEIFYMIRSCLYYLLVSRKIFEKISLSNEANRKDGASIICYLCLLYQYTWKMELRLDGKGENLNFLLDKYIEKIGEKVKCPYDYKLRPKKIINFFNRITALPCLKKVRLRKHEGILFFERLHPMPVEVKHFVRDRKGKNSEIPQKK